MPNVYINLQNTLVRTNNIVISFLNNNFSIVF